MDEIPNLGTTEDRQARIEKLRVDSDERQTLVRDARKKLYDEGYAVDGERVDGLLKDESLVPTEVRTRNYATFKCFSLIVHVKNAFSLALGKFGFDIFKILMVDLLHELELGVGKGVFAHLIRVVESLGPHQIHILNERCDEVDQFSAG